MQQPDVSSLILGSRFEGFLLVRAADQRTSKNGSQYLDMKLCDNSGDMECKMWTNIPTPPKAGSIVWVRGSMTEFNGRLQFIIERIRSSNENDDIDLTRVVPCAPEKPEDMLRNINLVIDQMKTPELQAILREMIAMCGDKLLYFPAAQRYHHAERAGLLHHTVTMLRAAGALCPLYPFLDSDLLFAGVIAHDLSKTNEFISDDYGNVSDYSVEGQLLGHLVHGVAQVQEAARRAGVAGEYVTLLSHMVISHHGKPEYGSPVPPKFAEAEMLHMLDDLDAKMNEFETVFRRTPLGVFSERISSLDRRVYRPVLHGTTQPADTEAESSDAEEPLSALAMAFKKAGFRPE